MGRTRLSTPLIPVFMTIETGIASPYCVSHAVVVTTLRGSTLPLGTNQFIYRFRRSVRFDRTGLRLCFGLTSSRPWIGHCGSRGGIVHSGGQLTLWGPSCFHSTDGTLHGSTRRIPLDIITLRAGRMHPFHSTFGGLEKHFVEWDYIRRILNDYGKLFYGSNEWIAGVIATKGIMSGAADCQLES